MNSCSTAAAAVGGRCEGIEDIDSLGEILDEVRSNEVPILVIYGFKETFMLVKRTSLLMFLLGKIKKKLIISEWTQVPCCLSTRAQVA